jgi:acyl CoA:acetate/3-ketoacid CoA transferase beta subunit
VSQCAYAPTGTGCVDVIVTDLAVMERDERGLVLRECSPGFSPADIQQLSEAPLTVELWSDMPDPSKSAVADWQRSLAGSRSLAGPVG